MVPEHAPIRTLARAARAPSPVADENDALQRAKSRAVIDLLNDLRTPLMMIKSPLQAKESDDEVHPDELLAQANRIQTGIEKALRILEMDSLDSEVEDDVIDMASVVDRYVSTLRPLADRCGVTIQYTTEISRAEVRMHLTKLQHLLETVTERQIRDTDRGDKVLVRLSGRSTLDGASVTLEIGQSNTPSAAAVDEPSAGQEIAVRRASIGDADSRMNLVRRHVLQYGGTFEEQDENYRITIPADAVAFERTEDTPDAAGGETERVAGERSGKETSVLIVDDHAGTRAYLRYALRKHHRVLEAADGEMGLDLVREHQPDLVISDIMMPVMDGNELCKAIKADDSLTHIPVFLVTANAMPSVRARSLESGADDYLVKPFDVEEAVLRINNEIKTRRLLRRRYSHEVVIKPSDIDVTSEDEALVQRAREIVEENMENADFSVQELADEIGLSSRQLQRRLREIVNQSPVEFIRNLRLHRAAQLLEARWGNVSEVAYRVGFTSLSYFAKCFKEEFGETPSAFKDGSQVG